MNIGITGLGAIGNGAGEAQIFQGNKALDVLIRNQQLRAAQARWDAQLQHQFQKERDARDRELMRSDFTKPGTFQQGESINEINNVKDLTRKYALANPNASSLDILDAVAEHKANVENRIARRNEIQDRLKSYQSEVLKNPENFDKEALSKLHDQTLSSFDENTGKLSNRDINEINPEDIDQIAGHPSVHNYQKHIVDKLAPIKAQMTYTPDGTVVDTPFGQLEKTTQHGIRFKNIEATTNYVIHSDPRIENKLYWEVSKDLVKQAGEPEDLNTIQAVYNNIRSNPKFNSLVYDKAEPVVQQLQQEVNKKYTKSIGTYNTAQRNDEVPTPEHYATTHKQMLALSNIAHDRKHIGIPDAKGNVDLQNPAFLETTIPLPEDNKWNGKEIETASPKYIDGKPVIHLVLKEGAETDLQGNKKIFKSTYNIPVDMKNTEYFNYMKQNHGSKLAGKMNTNRYLELHGKAKLDNVGQETSEKKGKFDDL